MATLYNPSGSKTNCGFCSIAYALHMVNHKFIDADRLYLETLARLGLRVENGHDPIPRQLIFPEPNLDSAPVRVEYQALQGGAHGLSSYTISSVATANGLNFDLKISGLELPRQFIQFSAEAIPDRWSLAGFAEWRLDWLKGKGLNPSPTALRRHIAAELQGHSIIGSKTSNHYINMHIDASGVIRADDAQDNNQYNSRGLATRMRTLDLMMRLR